MWEPLVSGKGKARANVVEIFDFHCFPFVRQCNICCGSKIYFSGTFCNESRNIVHPQQMLHASANGETWKATRYSSPYNSDSSFVGIFSVMLKHLPLNNFIIVWTDAEPSSQHLPQKQEQQLRNENKG